MSTADMGLNERSDADEAHCLKYNQVVADCFGKYFEKYAEKQVHLWLMVTRPEWRRRGAGTMLMRWGMENERVLDHKERWPITAFASPMGKLLYEHLGFDELATECIQIDGEEEKLTFSVMEQPFQS